MKLEFFLVAVVIVSWLLIQFKPFEGREVANPVEDSVQGIAAPVEKDGASSLVAKYRGRVVLVVFWATWCGPCVAEVPNLKKVYQDFHPKGFEIVAVSLDKNLEAVRKFTEQEQIPWVQIADGKGFKDDLAREYQVSGIPAHFLYGRDGKVIDRNLVYGAPLYRTVEREVNKPPPLGQY